jgi:hypothetical protein
VQLIANSRVDGANPIYAAANIQHLLLRALRLPINPAKQMTIRCDIQIEVAVVAIVDTEAIEIIAIAAHELDRLDRPTMSIVIHAIAHAPRHIAHFHPLDALRATPLLTINFARSIMISIAIIIAVRHRRRSRHKRSAHAQNS